MIDDCGLMIIDPLTTGSTPVPDVCVKHAEPEPRSEPKPPSMADEASLAIRESVRAKIASSPKANGRRPPCSGDVRAQLVAEAAAAGSTAQILGLLTVHRTHLGKPGRHQGAQLEARLAQYTLEQQRAMLVAAIVQRKPDMQRIDLTESQP